MAIRSVDDFDSSNISILTSANKGTILHRIMRFIDLEAIRNGTISFEFEIEAMINDGYLNICSPDNVRDVANEFREGIEAFCKVNPDIPLIVGALDRCLNENAYICPGLGDAGDRIFGTK